MTILRDIRFAIRSLSRVRLFTIAAVGSLTLGIATATTVFSLVDAAVLRQPPFERADRLMLLNITQRTPGAGELRVRWSWPRFRLLQQNTRSFEGVGSSSNAVLTITGVDDPEPLPVELVSSGYLRVLRAPMALGSVFDSTADDAGAAAGASIVLAYDTWQRRFGGARDVIGRVLSLNGERFTVVGVAGRGFAGVSGLARAWIPAPAAARVSYPDYLTTNQNFITVVGRLRSGVTPEAARAEMQTLGKRIQELEPSEAETPRDRFSATATSLNEARVDVVTRRGLFLLSAAAGVLLLIACANVASLLLGRAATRRREIAIRVAVGARRERLVRQLLVESGVLSAISGALGLLVSMWAIAVIRIPPTLARGRNFYGAVGEFTTPMLDWRVVAFVVAVCTVAVALFGLVPALRTTRADLTTDLKAGGGKGSMVERRTGARELVVALQVALAIVLVTGCGLLLASYARLRQTPLGFDPEHLLTFMIRPSEVRYPPDRASLLLDRVLEEVRRVPGVQDATVDGCTPLATQCANAGLYIVGRTWSRPGGAPGVLRHYVAPSHFRTLGIPLLRGREFTERDRAGAPHVVVINEAAAERFWPNADPIGARVWWDAAPAFGSADSAAEVVGVVGNVAYQPLDENPVQPGFFTPYAQFTYATRMVLVRTRGEPLALTGQVASAVQRADPDLALFDVQSMEHRARGSWAKQSAQTVLFTIIAAIALTLAVAGVYAVTSYFVTDRTREIGIRIAMGAPAGRIIRTSVARTMRLGLVGGVAGMLGAVALSRVMRAMLYDTSPLDAGVYLTTAAVLIAALIVASYIPVRRALGVDPVEVLRSE
ncbi:MAG TPA: ABC transporter permease [Gemmatimonadaceae bacterium]|nr:ABC transporter permease [Gemmatimonadaceae bacterium]